MIRMGPQKSGAVYIKAQCILHCTLQCIVYYVVHYKGGREVPDILDHSLCCLCKEKYVVQYTIQCTVCCTVYFNIIYIVHCTV